jgi:hypothetical protein
MTMTNMTPEQFEETKRANAWYPGWSTFDPKNKADVKNYQRAFNARAKEMGSTAYIADDGDFGEQTVSARIAEAKKTEPISVAVFPMRVLPSVLKLPI